MPKRHPSAIRFLFVAWFALLLSACASVGDYGYPGTGYPPTPARQELLGTVSNVDHGNRRFLLGEDGGRRADVSYDARTRLTYRGQVHPVSGLEPGDRVRVYASRGYGSVWLAQDIEVLQDVRAGGYGSGYGSGYGEVVQRSGVIDYVDPRARTIDYTEGGYTGSRQQAAYDSRTVVEYRGRRYPVDALERGDLVRLDLRRNGGGWLAERVLVEVSSRER
jgi:hypothetical protein